MLSIEMVIFAALGGRLSILGAVCGTLLVNWAKTTLSESFPELWLLGLGALFIAVVMFFPNGLAGLWSEQVMARLRKLFAGRGAGASPPAAPGPANSASAPDSPAAKAAAG
ncbi:hypothetical protein [Rhodovulum sp.]|uniref:hypothetical protein n=1 Tax=Rhodovulum sp. TaxID=34009 RepID=UPI002580B55F|nr:hypothetical protein [Rhodovulum sp.]